MITIVNISADNAPKSGVNQYELRINDKIICQFEHDRQPDGLAQCLRDAADAVDNKNDESSIDVTELRDIFGIK